MAGKKNIFNNNNLLYMCVLCIILILSIFQLNKYGSTFSMNNKKVNLSKFKNNNILLFDNFPWIVYMRNAITISKEQREKFTQMRWKIHQEHKLYKTTQLDLVNRLEEEVQLNGPLNLQILFLYKYFLGQFKSKCFAVL